MYIHIQGQDPIFGLLLKPQAGGLRVLLHVYDVSQALAHADFN